MNAQVLQIDLPRLSERLSRWFGCRVSVAEVRDLLQSVGFVRSPHGWITNDLRPLMLLCQEPGRPLFPSPVEQRWQRRAG